MAAGPSGDVALAAEYAALKKLLAVQFRVDREAYTEAKTPFVRRVLAALSMENGWSKNL